MSTLIDIDCDLYDCKEVTRLVLDAQAFDDYLRSKGVDPAAAAGQDFAEDLAKVYAKCCAARNPPKPPTGALTTTERDRIVMLSALGFIAPVAVGPDGILTPEEVAILRRWLAAMIQRLSVLARRLVLTPGGIAISYLIFLFVMSERESCLRLLNLCLLYYNPRRTRKSCLDCYRNCVNNGYWPFHWCSW